MKKSTPKIAFITTLQPATHYSRYLVGAMQKPSSPSEIYIWADNDPKNRQVPLKNVKPLWNPKGDYVDQILVEAKRLKPDLIHIQHEINMFGGSRRALRFPSLPRALKQAGFKVLITFHAVVAQDDINSEFLQAFSLPRFKPLILVLRAGFRRLFRQAAKFADGIIVHSEVTKHVLVDDYGINSEKISVIPIGIPPKASDGKSTAPKTLKLPKDAKVLLYFGYLIRRKGLEYLIDGFATAARKQKNLHLILAGGALDYQKDYPEELKKRINKLPCADRFHFTGFVSEPELNWLYDRSLALILPYTLSISSSLPLSFAFQHGKPVLASSIGTLRDEIRSGRDGLLFAPKSAKAITNTVEKLMKKPALQKQLQAGALENLQTRSWNKVGHLTANLYKQLVNCK